MIPSRRFFIGHLPASYKFINKDCVRTIPTKALIKSIEFMTDSKTLKTVMNLT